MQAQRPGPAFAFYDWCACNDDIPELVSLARTVSRWEDEIVCAVLTGITNATSESLNRLAKLEARLAYEFRNPANQRRRVRIACTRARRRPSRTATARRIRQVTGQNPIQVNFEEPLFEVGKISCIGNHVQHGNVSPIEAWIASGQKCAYVI